MAGTGIAAIAAIGGLWAQAVATYWSQQTAKDQLAQSREDSDAEQRAQAARVTFWIDERDGLAHFANTSSDPVSDPAFLVGQESDGRYVAVYALPSLAPCTEAILQFTGLELDIARHIDPAIPPGRKGAILSWRSYHGPMALAFVDRAGIRWVRSPTGLRENTRFDGGASRMVALVDGTTTIKIKKAELCDGNAT
ncbi:hypothetical protein ACIRU3_21540 [Streptomyces sp. NPDC101151]|uniref:hypothetical protein n=1 Tax=Streptomyces sp. NPDC101151 TaxID=3366115 RepID=UPI0037F35021